jgi:hypothetical protein
LMFSRHFDRTDDDYSTESPSLNPSSSETAVAPWQGVSRARSVGSYAHHPTACGHNPSVKILRVIALSAMHRRESSTTVRPCQAALSFLRFCRDGALGE